ncbi:MAG: hypothetical protein DCF20_02405 [Pseudanabaena sp.]|nr:MAG: hypothetical protein DCF20_02405 [Pseudanabaena sp.]
MANIHLIDFKFPQYWQQLKSSGAANFITQVIHRLPSGNLHIWSSRRFRKRRSSEIRMSEGIKLTKSSPKPWKYWGWQMQSLTWWIGFIFTVGSLIFAIGSIPAMFPNPPDREIAQINFIGSVCFTIGSYAALLEVINLNLDIKLERDAEIFVETIGSVRHPNLSLTKIKWFDWQPHRIEFQSTLIQFFGACLFNINCFFATVSGLTWQIIDLIVWLPSTLASFCFCWASYLAVMEVCHSYWDWKPQDIDWWIVILNLIGSVGFLSGSLFGFWGQGLVQCCQEWGTNFSFLAGSLFFLGGSYLMVPEMLDR